MTLDGRMLYFASAAAFRSTSKGDKLTNVTKERKKRAE
jgi:hypothetical protein